MRLLFVTSFYPPITGGGSSRIYDLSRSLASMGLEVRVLTFSSISNLFRKEGSKEVEVLRVPALGLKHPLDQILTGFIGVLLVSRARDFVITSVPMGEPCIGAFFACSFLGKRMVVDVRDEWEDAVIGRTRHLLTKTLYNLYRKLFNTIYQKSTFVTTVTPTLMKRMEQRGVSRMYLIPNGADLRMFHPLTEDGQIETRKEIGLKADDFMIVYAGRIGWYYRIDTVIKALDILVNKQKLASIKFLAMGAGESVEEYLKLSKSLALDENVIFLGERRREEVAKILPCCDLGVIPFDDDPIWLSAYTTKIFEYCASGLPVIVSVVSGSDLQKLVKKNNIGFTTTPMRPVEMAEAILEAYKNKAQLKIMRANARNLAIRDFDRKKIAEKLANILKTHQ